MTIEVSGLLVKKNEDGTVVHVYPITSTENVMHGQTKQLDEVLNELEGKSEIKVGSTIPQSVSVDTYFMKIEEEEVVS